MAVQVHLLGEMYVEGEAGVVDASAFPGRQGRIAFAALACLPHPVSRDHLAEIVWGDALPKSWERDLSAIISKLRSLLNQVGIDGASVLPGALGTYHLKLPADAVFDVQTLWSSVEHAEHALRARDLENAVGCASVAANLGRRPFLPGEEGTWVDERRADTRSALVRAFDVLVSGHRERGHIAEAQRYAEEVVTLEPFRESGYITLMRLHLHQGNRAEALRVYERCRTLLGEALGVPPSPDTETVYLEALRADLDRTTTVPVRGTVALLFTDLVGSTELAESLGFQEAETLRRTHFTLLRDAVQASGGHEVKNLGDGLMVAFGSASEAVACATTIQRAVDRHNRERPQHALSVRVGLHIGEPIADEGDYFGLPVVVAKRLCDHANGGEILMSDVVRALASSRRPLACEPVGPLTLKGLAEPITAFKVAWAAAARDIRLRALPVPATTRDEFAFLGREQHLADLEKWLDQAGTGPVRLVLVGGEPGIGKTRLLREFAEAAMAQSANVVWGGCDEEGLVAYQPVVEILSQIAGAIPDHDDLSGYAGPGLADMARIVPAMASRLGEAAPPGGSDPRMERQRFFDAAASFLARVAADRHLLVVFDDLHWADAPTITFVQHLVRHPVASKLLVVAGYRTTDVGRTHPLADALAELRRDDRTARIALAGLGETEVSSLFAPHKLLLESERVALSRALYDTTEGNPFFLREIVRHFADTGVLERQPDGWHVVARPERIAVPEGVREVVGRRLGALSSETNEVLRVAAVVGLVFDVDLLAAVTLRSDDAVLALIEEAVDNRILSEVAGRVDRFAFAHALVRETIYEELTTSRRVRLHQQIGEAIERLSVDDPGARLSELAHHFSEASARGDNRKALEYCTRAGQRALERLAFEEAATHYQRALDISDESADRVPLLLALGAAVSGAGRTVEAQQIYGEAFDLARALEDVDAMAAATFGYARFPIWVSGGTSTYRAEELLDATLDAIGPDDSPVRARLLACKAEQVLAEDGPRAQRFAEDARAMAQRVGDAATTVEVWQTKLLISREPTADLATMRTEARDLIDAARACGRRDPEMMGYAHLMYALLEGADIDGVETLIEEYGQRVADAHLTEYEWQRVLWKGMVAILYGDLAQAETLSREAFEIGREPYSVDVAGMHFFAQRHAIRAEQDRGAELLPMIEHVAALDAGPTVSVSARCTLAALYARAGRRDDALAALADTSVEHASLTNGLNYLNLMMYLATACIELDDHVRAAEVLEALWPLRDRIGWDGWATVCLGPAALAAGQLATMLDRYEEADESFRLSMERSAALRSRPWSAHTRYQWAVMLSRRRLPGDEERSHHLAREALGVAEELGLARLVRLSSELLA